MSTNGSVSLNNNSKIHTNGVAVTTLVKMGEQWVKVTPLINGQALYAADAKTARSYGQALLQPADRFVKQIMLGNMSPSGEIKKEFMEPGITTVIMSRSAMTRYNQDGVPIDSKSYHSHIAIPQTFTEWEQAVYSVLTTAVEDSKELTSRFEKASIEDEAPFKPEASPKKLEPWETWNPDWNDKSEEKASSVEGWDVEIDFSEEPKKEKTSKTSISADPKTNISTFAASHSISDKLTPKQKDTLQAIHEIFAIYQNELKSTKDRKKAYEATVTILRQRISRLDTEKLLMRVGGGSMSGQAFRKETKKVALMVEVLIQDIRGQTISIEDLKKHSIEKRF